jgi:IS5 family transposase
MMVSGESGGAAPDLDRVAKDAGVRWAADRSRDLRAQKRPIVGAWPGTITEARTCVLTALRACGARDPSVDELRELAKTAYGAARTSWRAACEPDLE